MCRKEQNIRVVRENYFIGNIENIIQKYFQMVIS